MKPLWLWPLVSFTVLWWATVLPLQAGEEQSTSKPLCLENALYRLEVERDHGRLLRFLDKEGHVDLRCPPELAANFQLLIPADSQTYIHGKNQRITSFESSENRLVLRWDGPLQDPDGREHDLAATMSIGQRAISTARLPQAD